jgi:hypothetical protein
MTCYIARTPCHCYVAALVISTASRERFREDAKEVLRWMREGLLVEVVTTDFVRANLAGCAHRRKGVQETLPLAPASAASEP